ncbi:hypothetical protein [Rhodoferax sp. WC2427]|uniref:hypothetical protein n=1 Tax=Rhodoferax sp. WC2427 TaxID=3234144 RepID=UPI0034679CFA
MPKLNVIEPFKWAHRHVDIKEYVPGDTIDTTDADLIRVAVDEEGWCEVEKSATAPSTPRRAPSVPKNKAVPPAPASFAARVDGADTRTDQPAAAVKTDVPIESDTSTVASDQAEDPAATETQQPT